MRVYINLCSLGSQPQEPSGEKAPAPSQRGPSQHCFFPSCQASFLRPMSGQLRPDSELSGSEASAVLWDPLAPTFLRSEGPPKGQPACKCPPYLARLSHGAMVTDPWLPEVCMFPFTGLQDSRGGTLQGWIT